MVNDGKIIYVPDSLNRWTAGQSPNDTDWLEIDFGEQRQVGRIDLAILDDGGGVQAPASYNVEFWDGTAWRDAPAQQKSPPKPVGGQLNEVRFAKAKTTKV